MNWYRPSASYKWHEGFVAWVLHRVTGLLLILYLFAHEWVISNLQNPQSYSQAMGVLESPVFKLLEVGLWLVAAYHAVNGLRVVLVNFAGAAERSNYKTNVWIFWVIFALVFVAGAIPMLMGLAG
ncbi:MAG: succinate dehydrogenase, cytochrome b556 subunit [Desulfurella sp.]|jgi:succinate dehydrogenase / fumarate reductase cytochrome b subunit|uniref:Succinate dehydrogenase cytochrome b556 subunit n=2 Tax=Desulfurella TaxID=33001 RepID=A0A1G6KKF3_9BACT|nr:succinate dehydrogenase, cytochrome b556 subunit [Desulfurella multipotens]AHF96724.1 succinate dehydrogenase [Desulfurella acetivorans A63]PMP67946.1 MAG: succinate dehydrogenase, cytochrome b556 subunit [Desulfurella multipotens]SDC31434.1 succinate dehydrogenase subunit C [Desulfurella multipotens]